MSTSAVRLQWKAASSLEAEDEAIAWTIARLAGGDLELGAGAGGTGLRVTFNLPIVDKA